MNRKFAVIGLGRFGMRIALSLVEAGAEVLVIDKDIRRVEAIAENVMFAVALDATDKKNLEAHNIDQMDAVVVSIGEDFEALLITAVNCKELGVERVITRYSTDTQRAILKKLGFEEIFSPEDEVGRIVAKRLIHREIETFVELPDDHEIVEMKVPAMLVGRSVRDIDLRKRYHINLITIRRKGGADQEQHVIGVPTPETAFLQGDELILMGKREDLQRFLEENR